MSVASARTTTAMQRQRGVAVTAQETLALRHIKFEVPALQRLHCRRRADNGDATAMLRQMLRRMVTQQGRLYCQCRKDGGEAMTTRCYVI